MSILSWLFPSKSLAEVIVTDESNEPGFTGMDDMMPIRGGVENAHVSQVEESPNPSSEGIIPVFLRPTASSVLSSVVPVVPMAAPSDDADIDFIYEDASREASYYMSDYVPNFSSDAEFVKKKYRDDLATDCIQDRNNRPEKYGFLKDPRAKFIAYYSDTQRVNDGVRGVINHKSAYTAMFSGLHEKDIEHQLKNYPDSRMVFIGKNFTLNTRILGVWLEATYEEALFKEVK